jgi:hypothetical protein
MADKLAEQLKKEWLEILEQSDDPDFYQTIKALNDGHQRGDGFQYKQGLHAALKGEGANPLILDHAFHDGYARMVWAMKENGIEPLPPSADAVLALPPRHKFKS